MGACAAATCRGLPVMLNTPSALHFRVLHAVVTPRAALRQKGNIQWERRGGNLKGGMQAREGGRGQGAGEAEMECQEGSLCGAKREAARGTHFVHKHLPL